MMSPGGLVPRIIETDEVTDAMAIVPQGQAIPPIVSQVDFEYDNRNRLTREMRVELGAIASDTGSVEYDLSYTYDAGGNRLTKADGLTGRITTYVYDIETDNALDNNQHNNRLLGYDITEPGSVNPVPVEKAHYRYGPAGNVMLLVKQLDMNGDGVIDQNDLAAVWWFYYDAGNHLWLAVQGTANFDEATGALSGVAYDKAAEYRYDGGRQRYLVRQRDPNPVIPEDPNSPRWTIVGTGQWRDYRGNNVYNDYTVDTAGTVTNGTGHLPGIGFDDPSLPNSASYYGSDLIGTTRRVSDSSMVVSPVVHRSVLTAFGEPVSTAGTGNTRYGYAGVWGYETPEQSFDPLAELGWQHVGERYYDPAVGRFMQRDPIGIRGGMNVYVYVRNKPSLNADPLGLYDEFNGLKGVIVGVGAAALFGAAPEVLACAYFLGLLNGLEPSDVDTVSNALEESLDIVGILIVAEGQLVVKTINDAVDFVFPGLRPL